MLSKLLKYEIKSTARLFLPLYMAVIIFAGINRLLFSNSFSGTSIPLNLQGIISFISMFIYVILIVGMMAMTLIVMIQRFYKSLLGDEGYLMFTLPVQTWKHIMNKLIVAMFWTILSAIIAVCSIFIIAYVNGPSIKFSEISELFRNYIGYTGMIEIVILVLLSIAAYILMIYAAIALGHLFSKHKLLASFGMYIGISTISQMLLTAFIPLINLQSFTAAAVPSHSQIQMLFLYSIIYSAIVIIGCFALSNLLLKRNLNLE